MLVRKGQRTGIFDLEDVGAIQLNPVKSKEDEPMIMDNPHILIDATDIKRDNGKILISHAMLIVKEQLRVTGIRKVTREEYIYTMYHFVNDMELVYVNEITVKVLLEWLSKLGDVSNVTKNSRLRVIKAMLNRFYDNGWFEKNWWKPLKIKMDEKN